MHDAIHEFAHVDGKLLLTLRRLLARPGELTREVLRGRRARYASPLRLYLTCSLLFFALAAIVPDPPGIVTYKESARDSASNPSDRAEAEKMGQQLVQGISHSMAVNMPRAMFALMPLFATLTWLFYRNAQRFYLAHLYYSLHFHALAFLLFSVALILGLGGSAGRFAGALLQCSILAYHYIGLRRVFGGSRASTAMKGTAIATMYFVAIAGVLMAIVLLEVWRVRGLLG